MSLKAALIDVSDKRSLEIEKYWQGHHPIDRDERFLSVTTAMAAHSTFKSVESTATETVIITTPNDDGSLIIADLILGTERQTAGTVTIQFNDGTRTEPIYKAFAQDAPANFSTAIMGRIQGWRDAWVELVNVNATDCSVLLTYVKVPEGLPYDEWDTLR